MVAVFKMLQSCTINNYNDFTENDFKDILLYIYNDSEDIQKFKDLTQLVSNDPNDRRQQAGCHRASKIYYNNIVQHS
jgi:hypothetical protein